MREEALRRSYVIPILILIKKNLTLIGRLCSWLSVGKLCAIELRSDWPLKSRARLSHSLFVLFKHVLNNNIEGNIFCFPLCSLVRKTGIWSFGYLLSSILFISPFSKSTSRVVCHAGPEMQAKE